MVPLPTLCLWPPHFVIEHSLAASSSRCYYCLYISNCTLCVWVCLVRLINLFFFAGILLLFFDLLFIMYVASFLGFFFVSFRVFAFVSHFSCVCVCLWNFYCAVWFFADASLSALASKLPSAPALGWGSRRHRPSRLWSRFIRRRVVMTTYIHMYIQVCVYVYVHVYRCIYIFCSIYVCM